MASSLIFIRYILTCRKLFATTKRDFRLTNVFALIFAMNLWIYISFDTLFFMSNTISFNRLTARMEASSVGDHGQWFRFFLIFRFDINIPEVMSLSRSLLYFISLCLRKLFVSLSWTLLVLWTMLWCLVSSIRFFNTIVVW